ncbi:MAG: NAD(P)/FAD-dependent oxidoreductase [Chloroflexi bacterium]|nr:NAD(P)/FAD-dependent oxidoreductase [Chloroflexota bacterium]
MNRSFETVVIGGGQTGLSAGHHLAKRGVDFVILEGRQRIGDIWRSRWESLKLYSPARHDGLPGMKFPGRGGHFPTGGEMADYLESYADRQQLPVRTGVRVTRVHADGDGFAIETSDGRYDARQVIVASGGFRDPYVPAASAELAPSIRQLHSSEYLRPDQLADGPVLVVGLSHSGADIAHEAAQHGHRTILSGRAFGQLPFSIESRRGALALPLMRFLAWNVLTLKTPIGRKMAPKVRNGGGPLLRYRRQDLVADGVELRDARFTGARDGLPMLADGSVHDVATVVWCTGFRPDYSWVEPATVGEDGWPIQFRGVASDVSGLYFLGIPFQYSFTSMLVLGAGRDAAYVAEQVARRAAARGEFPTAAVAGAR